MTGCDSGGVGGCEGGKDGVAVAKVDAGGAKFKECRHVRFVDRATPEAVRDEDDYVVLLLGCRWLRKECREEERRKEAGTAGQSESHVHDAKAYPTETIAV
jgi:hypothetical protein